MYKIFETLVVVTGVVGALANALMLFCFIRSRPRNDSTIPILNQMIIDLFCGCLLVVSYAIKIPEVNIYAGYLGTALCKTLGSEAFLWSSLNSSTANLLLLSLERYTKVVHPVFHRKHFRRWMYGLAVVLVWIDVPALINAVISALTSHVEDGQCLVSTQFPTQSHRTGFAVWSMFGFFIAPLIILVYCYARMLHVTRKRTKAAVPNFNNMIRTSAQQNAIRVQLSVIKTFLIVSLCFVVCWCPTRMVFFLYSIGVLKVRETNTRHTTVFMAMISVSLNPFIYAAQLDPVRKYLRQMFRCGHRRVDNVDAVQHATGVAVVAATRGTTVRDRLA